MITLTTSQAERIMTKLQVDEKPGGRHKMARLRINGKLIFSIPIPHGRKELPTGTARSIFTSMHLSEDADRVSMRDCSMKREQYIEHLQLKNLL